MRDRYQAITEIQLRIGTGLAGLLFIFAIAQAVRT
jgi:hypothetical protein